VRVQPDNYRVFRVLNSICYLGFFAHASFIPLFFWLGVPLLAWFNVLSIAMWAGGWILNRNGHHDFAVNLITVEVIAHAALATWCFGWASSFQTYLMPMLVFTMINNRPHRLTTLLQGVAIVALYLGLYIITRHATPQTSALYVEIAHYVNIFVVFTGLGIVAWYYREASLKSEQRVRELADDALAASRAKSAFLANMSHELRTPLNGILGFTQILLRRTLRDPEDRKGLEVIRKSGEHLLVLINDVLSLSRIEAGRVKIDARAFDLWALMRDVHQLLLPRAQESAIALTLDIGEGRCAVLGDPLRVRQILLHLAGTAVKFTEKGSVMIRGRWRGGEATIDVIDTGAGIDEAEQEMLFQPFAQAAAGRESKEGTGLGLAVSRDVARLMGGEITFTSTRGKGSTFTLRLPLPETRDAIVGTDTERVFALASEHRGTRALVVDDLDVNRAVLARLLRDVGFDVREASDGDDAVAEFQRFRPRVVFMDKRMPRMDGMEAARRMRALEADGEHAAIIGVSASALDHERSEMLAADFDDFIAKPWREHAIFDALQRHLGIRYRSDASVLVVDDDNVSRTVTMHLLEPHTSHIAVAKSGEEALLRLTSEAFDIVFLDVRMPGIDGFETARRIRAGGGKSVLIALTAEDDPERLREAGFDDVLTKPLDPDALQKMMQEWVR